MILGHLAGVPFEEWLGPVIASGGGVVVAVRAVLRRIGARSEGFEPPTF